MSDAIDPRLQRLLGGEALAGLRNRLRGHFERRGPDAVPAVLRLTGLSAAEHAALAVLLGRPPRPSNSLQVDIDAIDAALDRAGIAPSLRAALEQFEGPIRHRATMRAEADARWMAAAARCRHGGLAALLRVPAGLGLLKRLARGNPEEAERLGERAEAVLGRLPADGLARAQLAADVLGDAHALDPGRATAALVLAAWRAGEAASDPADADDEAPATEERTRDVWARAGVLVNELARPALVLNLPAGDGTPGEPGYISLRRLLRSPPAWSVAGRAVHVCENPNLVAIAADRLGAGCAPLVCTEGMPAAAQRTLLAQLARAGARLLYHGDFDWPGLHIANQVMRSCGARPWRFGAGDYEAALHAAGNREHRLAGSPVTADWDAALMPAMLRHGLALPEEGVAATLLEDLRD